MCVRSHTPLYAARTVQITKNIETTSEMFTRTNKCRTVCVYARELTHTQWDKTRDMRCSGSKSKMKWEKMEHQMLKISNINANIEFCVCARCVVFFIYNLFSVIAERYGIKNEVKLFNFEPKPKRCQVFCILHFAAYTVRTFAFTQRNNNKKPKKIYPCTETERTNEFLN